MYRAKRSFERFRPFELLPPLLIQHYSSCYSFNSTLRTHLRSGHHDKALTHFTNFREQGLLPDNFSIPSLLKLCHDLNQPLIHGENLYGFAIKTGYLQDVFVSTRVIEMYFNHGCFSESCKVFDEITERDVVLWSTMVSGFSQNGLGEEALSFLSEMLRDGMKPNQVTLASVLSVCSQLIVLDLGRAVHGFSIRNVGVMADVILETALVDMYARCGYMVNSSRVFDRMGERSLASWNSIITGYANHGSLDVALGMFKEMMWTDGREPRSSTLVLVLQICGKTTSLWKGKEMHCYIVRSYRINSDSMVEKNSLIDMYVKSGDLNSATLLFKSVLSKNLVTWTTMIGGYGMHGLSNEALETFDEMKKTDIKPDGITFLALLSACSHGKLVQVGRELYISMQRDCNITPGMKHFACMVDLYARAGFLEEAFNFIEGMHVEPSAFIWESLLSSCRIYKNIELGEKAAKKALELNQYCAGVYILLSRLYADTGRWEDLSKVRLAMKEMGLMSVTARSWVEVKRKVYTFTVRDCLNRYSDEIYKHIETLTQSMKKAGFVSNRSVSDPKTRDEERESDLCGHTEKLALAFMLIKCGSKAPIRIGKNLRVCTDCHEFFKFTSEVMNREIILRDPNRYHRFIQGHCSCHDFW